MKTVAVTFTHDKSTYLGKWVDYYQPQVDELKVIETGDGFKTDWAYHVSKVNQIQESLLKDYDLIVFADVDEFIIPDPDKYKSLKTYLSTVTEPVIRCTGFNVMQMVGDKPLDLNRPVLSQRAYYSPDVLYNKYVIITQPQHYINPHMIEHEVKKDPDLIMFHLRDADIVSMQERSKSLGRRFNNEEFMKRRKQAVKIPQRYNNLV